MKKSLLLALVLCLLLTCLAACGKKGNAEDGNVAGDTIKIGWIGTLTGDQAVWGVCERDTIQMLVDEANAAGGIAGKQIEFIAYDTKGTPEEAVNAVNRLIKNDKALAILGPNASGVAIAISSILEQGKVADIATVATNPKVTIDGGKLKPYNFRVCFIDPYQGAVAASYAYQEAGFRKAAVLYDVSDEYSAGLTQFFEETFTKLGGEIVAKEAFKTGDVEFRAQLTKIKDTNPDVIFLPFFFKEVSFATKQASEMGIKTTFMGGDGWTSDQLISMAGPYIQGSFIVNHVDFDDPDVQGFKNQYKAAYPGKTVELNAYLGHDAFVTVKAAIEKVAAENNGAITSAKVAKALEGIEVKGVTGTIHLSPDDHNPLGKEAAIIKVEGEGYKFMRKFSVDLK